jgi:two-component system phosphate regulon response regulator PhoB
MGEARILVIEDEDLVRDMIVDVLEGSSYEVRAAKEGRQGLKLLREEPPDLVVLDLNLPVVHGLEVCREIRKDPGVRHVGVLILTGNRGDESEAMLFDAGADDYIRKGDFKPALFLRRVSAVLRRAVKTSDGALHHGPLTLHPARREALLDGKPVNLTPTEYDILSKLVSSEGAALSRRDLLDRGEDGGTVDRTVDVHVLSIRRKLGEHEWLVETVYKTGYRLGTPPPASR